MSVGFKIKVAPVFIIPISDLNIGKSLKLGDNETREMINFDVKKENNKQIKQCMIIERQLPHTVN